MLRLGSKHSIFPTIIFSLLFLGCNEINRPGENQESSSEDTFLLKSKTPRDTAPQISKEDLEKQVGGNNQFAFELYDKLRSEPGNVFISPYSISSALTMTYAGARNETAAEMESALNYALPSDKIHSVFNRLDLELSSRGEGASGREGEGFQLSIVNAIWGQKNYTFLPDFLNTLSENYGAGLRVLDFMTQPEESRVVINDWAYDMTNKKIEDLLPPGSISPLTRLVLTNAVYFDAAWQHTFKKESTSSQPFFLENGDSVSVLTMSQTASFKCSDENGYQAIELPYDGGEISMVIIMPKENSFASFEQSISEQKIQSIITGLSQKDVSLHMPKFEFTFGTVNISDALKKMGMVQAFSGGADFSGMDDTKSLYIDGVYHQAFVAVDEEGTTAAGATGVVVNYRSIPVATTMRINRPFLFLIRDIPTNTILFLGRMFEP